MKKAKIYCQVSCGNCGTEIAASDYYENEGTIRRIKKFVSDWVWDEENCMNLCPVCRMEREHKKEGE